MARVLFFGGEDADVGPLRSAAARLASPPTVQRLCRDDPFADLGTEPPAMLLVDLDPEPTLGLALCRVVRKRHPSAAIVVAYRAADVAAREAVLQGAADGAFDRRLGDDALAVLLERRLACAAAAAAPALKASLGLSDLDALSLLVRGLAHEVNNPLTTIRGFLQLLLSEEGRTSQDDVREALATMESESRRIAEVVQELEYFGGGRRPVRTTCDLVALVRDALSALVLDHVKARGDLSAPLEVDREQTSLALRHLLGWAASFAPDGRSDLEVTIERGGASTVLRVAARVDPRVGGGGGPLLVPLHAVRGQGRDRRSLAFAFGIARAHGGALTAERKGADRIELTMALPG